MSQIEKTKCLIIGSGPAGYTAAIYAARADMSPVLYQGLQPGGQLTTTNEVENFPGYKDGVTGPEMMVELEAQAKRFDADVRPGFINKVDFSGSVHKCWADNGQEIHAETVVIATGASTSVNSLVAIARINGPTFAPLTPAREIQPLVSSPLQVTKTASPVNATP